MVQNKTVTNVNEKMPQCRWACNDPAILEECEVICSNVNGCTLVWKDINDVAAPDGMCPPTDPECDNFLCPGDMCAQENCPQCEATTQLTCEGYTAQATPSCQWRCAVPTTVVLPECELICEQPGCEAQQRLVSQKHIPNESISTMWWQLATVLSAILSFGALCCIVFMFWS